MVRYVACRCMSVYEVWCFCVCMHTSRQCIQTHYKEEQTLRKKYYNMIEDLKGSIRVFCRARPLASGEQQSGEKVCCCLCVCLRRCYTAA